jgi:RHS repeat-associated protein
VAVKDAEGNLLKGYAYDGLHRRIQETAGGVTTDLYYSDAWQVLEERVGGQTTVQYVWSPVYVDALVLRDRDSDGDGTLDERLHVVQDANYNITALLDNAGNVVERYVYDPFGQATILDANWTERAASAFAWVYLHQGGRFDDVSGLYHFRYRDYSPTLGRWTSLDPIRYEAGDVNLYRTVFNAPTVYTDPSGQVIWFAIFALAVVGAGGAGAYYGATTGQESGTLEGFIPGWGAGRTSGAAFANGEPVKGVFYALLVPLDAITMGSVGSGCIRVGVTQGAKGFVPGTFRIAVGPGASLGGRLPHMAWRVSGSNPLHAGGDLAHGLRGRAIWPPFDQRVTHEGAMEFWFRTGSETAARFWFRRGTRDYPFLPVLNRGLASLAGGRASSCYSATFGAWSRGNYHLVPYLGSHVSFDLLF